MQLLASEVNKIACAVLLYMHNPSVVRAVVCAVTSLTCTAVRCFAHALRILKTALNSGLPTPPVFR